VCKEAEHMKTFNKKRRVNTMKRVKTAEATERKGYEKPQIRSEKEEKKPSFGCPKITTKQCSVPIW
jgi:hypothetical protein